MLLSYVLSFVYVGIYWNNHHHMLHAAKSVGGGVLWANLHLLFWLSLIPFASGWMGENHFSPVTVMLYGVVLLLCGVAYFILTRALIVRNGTESALAVGRGRKGSVSLALYVVAIGVALFSSAAAMAIFVLVAAIWLVPDRRIERVLGGG